ncbi:hypothetical protein FD975_02275 [Polynucleobacter sp. AP-Jannik-300A-C4]|uniref:flagellin N-terminal helical domain-containing protein n=1 Tax=Polynucleobacter sp. AP-Jannik-300A-C4 TaxID=2576928 RepID=UPI001BFEE956|nr:flagellin [Polynucleobacter sp. AP-Jannik-300A-C4]QWE23053.1 hypothetical protein FD975_02275 [Polynucleobacter sp. AP-Jannik-300A-C4]
MSTVINTNLASLFAQNSLSNAQNNLATSVQRLSSGLRINSAKDDAAGLAISQNMQSQINGTNQSVRNLSDATNLLQTADTSLSSIQDMLLRLKQLSVQGYDGSLSANQKLDIVQEMKDLNTEINATAQRTAFNGINLLTSGSSIDSVNSDLVAGQTLTTTAVAVATTAGTLGVATKNLGDAATSTYSIAIDPSLATRTPGTYTFTSLNNQLTMTGTFNGLSQSQTVTVADAPSDNLAARTTSQVLNFDKFGVAFTLNTTNAAAASETGAVLAAAIVTKGSTLVINGVNGDVTDVRLSGVAPGTYTMATTATGADYLKLSGTINGVSTVQEIQLSTNAANATETVNFSSFGIQFDIKSYQQQTGAQLVTALTTRTSGAGSTTGAIIVGSGNNSALKFQSGPTSDQFIQIDTLNVQTGSSGSTAGQAIEMMTLGTRITSSSAGNLGTLGAGDTIDTWQTAFKNAAAAVDNALEYISTKRATFGSQMNRLSFVSTNLQAQSTNLQNSRSAIIDTDFAAETAKLTKGQIMQQAATAMLAQANQMPNVILSLLK